MDLRSATMPITPHPAPDRLVVLSSAGPSGVKARALADVAIDLHGGGTRVELPEGPGLEILDVRSEGAFDAAARAVGAADVVVIAAPASDLVGATAVTTVFDRLPPDVLDGIAVVFVVVVSAADRPASVDAAAQALARIGGRPDPSIVHVTAADFLDGRRTVDVRDVVREALAAARRPVPTPELVAT
jgi:hypothetical protein